MRKERYRIAEYDREGHFIRDAIVGVPGLGLATDNLPVGWRLNVLRLADDAVAVLTDTEGEEQQ